MRLLFATTELYPYEKYGGLGDVAAALPLALQKSGVDVRYFLPGYQSILDALERPKVVVEFSIGEDSVRLLLGDLTSGLKAYVVDCPDAFCRPHAYLGPDGKDWPDNHQRFGLFCRVAADFQKYDGTWLPDVIQANDWQCGLIPAYLHYSNTKPKPRVVMSLHNMGYQGLFPKSVLSGLGLPAESFDLEGLEYYDQVGFLKAGIYYSDCITTVSPTYAHEISHTSLGYGLEGLLRTRRKSLHGILNGIDDLLWNPEFDPLVHSFNFRKPAQRRKNRQALLKEFGLKDNRQMVAGFIGRLTPQKGVQLLLDAIPSFIGQNISFILIGNGDADLEEKCKDIAARYPEQVAVHVGYDEELSHRFYAGIDSLVVPSIFEPCGLVQLYAMRYGAVPIVHNTGGLADTVDSSKGFVFSKFTEEALTAALLDALSMFETDPSSWKQLQKAGMQQDFSWDKPAVAYGKLFDSLCQAKSLPLSELLVA